MSITEIFTQRKQELVCRLCGRIVLKENKRLFCDVCGTHLIKRPFPSYWIFQFNPRIYRWLDRIRETQEPERWLTSQNSKEMHIGDLAIIWSAGGKAGIYGFARITTDPSIGQPNTSDTKYWVDKTVLLKFQEYNSVTLQYLETMVENPILEDKCHNDSILQSLQVFMNPQGTNFRLSLEQWMRIGELMIIK
jgi:hypothetical protein